MWRYEKRLQFPVNIKEPNAKIAKYIMSQYGGPDGRTGLSRMPRPGNSDRQISKMYRSYALMTVVSAYRFLRGSVPL